MGGVFFRAASIVVLAVLCAHQLADAQEISDSLVENLSCSDLSVPSIFQSIRRDAFSSDRHLPIKNFSIPTGGGICNGLSTMQRLFFYLARFENREFELDEIDNVLPVLRGRMSRTPHSSRDHFSYDVVDKSVFEIPYNGSFQLSTDLFVNRWAESGELADILDGFQFKKNFLPYSIATGWTVLSKSLSRNRRSIQQVVDDISRNRLHKLSIFRKGRGHSVLPTTVIKNTEDEIILGLYDPNYPGSIIDLIWTPEKLHYGPLGTYSEGDALFAVISDDHELRLIERTLLKYYRKKCAG